MYEPEFWAMFGHPAGLQHLQQQQQQQAKYPQQQHPFPPQYPPYPLSYAAPAPPAAPSPVAAAASPCWSREDDKAFENALVRFPEETPNRWECVAAQVHGKTVTEVARHYQALVQDVSNIEAGRILLPEYESDEDYAESPTASGGRKAAAGAFGGGKAREERKKGVPWTEDEHRRFLEGLEKYGKGDWRSISRNAVVTRTPTQVASHAQKYFIRLNSAGKKEKKRGSIHDITKP